MRSEIWPHTFAIFDKWLWCDTKISYILWSNLKTVMGTFQISSFTCQTICSMGDVRAVLWYYWHMNGLRWRAKHNLSLWLAVVQYDSCSMHTVWTTGRWVVLADTSCSLVLFVVHTWGVINHSCKCEILCMLRNTLRCSIDMIRMVFL